MDDPTGELRRQRDLIAAHLRWLDEQIARKQAASPPPVGASPSPSAAPVSPQQVASATAPIEAAVPLAVPTAAAALPEIAMPEIDPGSVRNEVRRGCFIYVIVVTVLLAASIAVAVWIGGQ